MAQPLSFSQVPDPQFKYSCGPCKKRKTKCERVQPCSSCVLRRTTHDCYTDASDAVPVTARSSKSRKSGANATSSSSAGKRPVPPPSTDSPSIASSSIHRASDPVALSTAESEAATLLSLSAASSNRTSLPYQFDAIAGSSVFPNKRPRIEDGVPTPPPPPPPPAPAPYTRASFDTGAAAAAAPAREQEIQSLRSQISALKDQVSNMERQIGSSGGAASTTTPSSAPRSSRSPDTPATTDASITASSSNAQQKQPMDHIPAAHLAAESESRAFSGGGRMWPDLIGHRVHSEEPVREVSWATLAPHFSDQPRDVERLIEYHFTELHEWLNAVPKSTVMKSWQELQDGKLVLRSEAALVVLIAAIAGMMVPAAAPLLRLNTVNPREKHREWFCLAFRILDEGKTILSPQDYIFERMLCDSAAIMYSSFAGETHLTVKLTAEAVSRAHFSHIFDENHRSWHSISDFQREYRRRLAMHLLIADRWQAFHLIRPFVIHSSTIKVEPPMYEPESCFDPQTGMRVQPAPVWNMTVRIQRNQLHTLLTAATKILHEMHDPTIRPTERYLQITSLDTLAKADWANMLQTLGLSDEELTKDYGGSVPIPPDAVLRRLSMPCMMSVGLSYIVCMIYRPLLEDPKAPIEMRFKAFEKAQKIIELLPLIQALVQSPNVPFPLSFTSTALLAASTTFAVPLLFGASADLEKARAMFEQGPPSAAAGGRGGPPGGIFTGAGTGDFVPGAFRIPTFKLPFAAGESIEEVASSRISKVLECLETFDIAGDYAAKICRKLLHSLCNSREELQMRVGKASANMRQTQAVSDEHTSAEATAPTAALTPNRASTVTTECRAAISTSSAAPGAIAQDAVSNTATSGEAIVPAGNLTISLPAGGNSDLSFLDSLLIDNFEWADLIRGLDFGTPSGGAGVLQPQG